MIAVNAEYAAKWPVITSKKEAPHDADKWEHVKNKYPEHFSPEPWKHE